MPKAALTSEAGCDFRVGLQPGRRDRFPTFLAHTVSPAPKPLERLRELGNLIDEPTLRFSRSLSSLARTRSTIPVIGYFPAVHAL